MKDREIYGHWFVWEELIAYRMMIYYWIKGDKIHKMLSDRIERARHKAEYVTLSEKNKNEFLIEYDKLDDFFSFHFKEIDQSRSHNFEDKISYCLKQYRIESSRHINSKNLIILQENFLNGAEKTLFLYFVLDKKVKREISLSDIMIGKESSELFLDFLQDKKFIDENHNLLVDQKSSFIRIHRFLKDNYVINPDFQDSTIIEAMENEYNTNFDKGTFSRAITVKANPFEEKIFEELANILKVKY